MPPSVPTGTPAGSSKEGKADHVPSFIKYIEKKEQSNSCCEDSQQAEDKASQHMFELTFHFAGPSYEADVHRP